ncbi:hypothetical protein [Corynebacterium uterequi]|uniref:Uncharacterized protein n=1 Tax=Corynebacterium uterequi TaxID=1072256 RepID=A0A0G3HDX0_9CORY|nr:hypothetical protein [Corynebacterium uterequi]AKK11514.1 hypothetical protein CUTER_07625 [Corynebacterium uterequi]
MDPVMIDRVDGARIARAARIVDDAGVVAMLDGWRGDDGRGGTTGGAPVPPSPIPRHESGFDEAAAVPNAPPLAA